MEGRPIEVDDIAVLVAIARELREQAQKHAHDSRDLAWPQLYELYVGRWIPNAVATDQRRDFESAAGDELERLLRVILETRRWQGHGASSQAQRACRVITLRLPGEVHAELKIESHRLRCSLNELLIHKALRPLPPGAEDLFLC